LQFKPQKAVKWQNYDFLCTHKICSGRRVGLAIPDWTITKVFTIKIVWSRYRAIGGIVSYRSNAL